MVEILLVKEDVENVKNYIERVLEDFNLEDSMWYILTYVCAKFNSHKLDEEDYSGYVLLDDRIVLEKNDYSIYDYLKNTNKSEILGYYTPRTKMYSRYMDIDTLNMIKEIIDGDCWVFDSIKKIVSDYYKEDMSEKLEGVSITHMNDSIIKLWFFD